MSSTTFCTRYPFAVIPMKLLPKKDLREKANKVITSIIAWDSPFTKNNVRHFSFKTQNQKLKQPWFISKSMLHYDKMENSYQGKTLLDGKFPMLDQHGVPLGGARGAKAGQALAGGWRGGFESWTGDWKERSLSHVFKRRNYQSTMVCDQCAAVNPHARTPQALLPNVYSNFFGPWRQTIRDHQTYLQETPVPLQTPWLSVPGFDISRVKWDVAHTVLLGCGKDIVGSFLWDLVSWFLYTTYFYIFFFSVY